MLAILVFLLLLCFLLSKPRLHLSLLTDEDYLSQPRTSFINGFFIVFVFICHILNGYNIGCSQIERWALHLLPYGQLIVTSFLFFSGYGMMCQMMRSRETYAQKLLKVRLPKLWIHFVLCISCFWVVSTFLVGKEYNLLHIVLATLTWTSFGNSNWYIGLCLLAYIIIAIAALTTSRWGLGMTLCVTSILLFLSILVQSEFREAYCVNTALCIPAGMAYALYRAPIETFLRKLPIPTLLIGLALLGAGSITHRLLVEHAILSNIGSILFAAGLCLAQGCISWRRPLPLLRWCGGPALFYLYILQRLPMLIGAYFGWNTDFRELYIAGCFLLTLALAFMAIPMFKKLDKYIFSN